MHGIKKVLQLQTRSALLEVLKPFMLNVLATIVIILVVVDGVINIIIIIIFVINFSIIIIIINITIKY